MDYGSALLPERFWDKVEIVADASIYPGPCWIWTGACTKDGYGQIYWPAGPSRYAHRIAYETAGQPRGPVLSMLDHLCRIQPCCNPEHLEPVTNRENVTRGAAGYALRSVCRMGLHDISIAENVWTSKATGRRSCLECIRENRRQAKKRYRSRLRAEGRRVL